ncbi:TonB-dependent receptor domain-containing protein [Qipengyuania nanhaisediminis]|uniref:TonB-dependent receptor n=1 Tax=Qipengyuania nanhaisediminis TaxID=604088 RepID=A0A1I5LNL9_9SPHN|nr:TonB-dependent receptor [Qipengyuania nanhaisediminis]SFO98406.1 TonB-dependent receptor [Qipengyuania nanhaisediminis]
MSTGKQLAGLLLLSTALTFPAAALAQSTGAEGPPPTEAEVPDEELTDDIDDANDTVPGDIADVEEQAQPDISVPGGSIIVTGRRQRDVTRSSSQVITVLDTESIARTGEGDIAGALGRVTGLSTQGNGLVYVRGLGDRYSLALLNGLPLPSPQPLSRVVPLDIFPTSVVASSLVQKTYSANFPGEFGGGVINLTTRAIPTESFVTVSASISGDSETTFGPGYTYYGGDYDWTGFDNGRRKVSNYDALQGFFDSGARIGDDNVDLQGILGELNDPNLILLQKGELPVNFSGGITAGTAFDVFEDGQFGVIATASLSNKWRNRFITRQTAVNEALDLDTDFDQFVTDNRMLANAMLGFGLEVGQHKFRLTNLFIHDTLKRASLARGIDFQDDDEEIVQDTSWFERQLFNTQGVAELEFGDLSIDLRGGYAQTKREAPFEYEFTYVRTNNENDPLGGIFLNTLDPQRGGAIVAFSDLKEDLYYGGADVSYFFADWLSATVGYANTDTSRFSTRREFDIRASSAYPEAFGAFRPDNLLGDALIALGFDRDAQEAAGIGPFEYNIFETTQTDPAFAADLEIHAGYAKLAITPFDVVSLDIGVRYEDAEQSVQAVEVFAEPLGSTSGTSLSNDYWLPGGTLTWEISDDLQFRASASKTIARPQFRELIFQTYFDPETNRQFNGNPRLVDSELINAEARLEYYFGAGSRISAAGFYKDIENPIEVFTSFSDNDIISGFANAPKAQLYGGEVEFQWNYDLYDLGEWFDSKRFVAIANYTYTQSEISVADDDIASVFPFADQPATNFFDDGVPLTGQSDHIVNLQLGLEDLDRLSQFTVLVKYASERVTSRGAGPLPDIIEEPGLQLDFVARQGVEFLGSELELKFEARNLTGTDHEEFQTNGETRIDVNSYQVGRSISLGASLKF